MKKLIYLILFIPVIGFGQTYPHQIEPDTTHRMIMMTDTSVIDSPAMEFLYFSIDSLVKQITVDTLGLQGGHWSKDDSLSLSPVSQTNNIVLGNLSGNTSFTGTYNFLAGRSLGNNLTTGSYNSIFGISNLSTLSTGSYSFSFGNGNGGSDANTRVSFLGGFQNAVNATNIDNSFIFGDRNNDSGAALIDNSTILGNFNVRNTTDVSDAFISGYSNAGGAGYYNQVFISGRENNLNGNNLSYVFINGSQNLYSSLNTNYAFANGLQNAYSADLTTYSFFNGSENFRNSSRARYSFASGYRNIYNSTSVNENVIAIGTENGYNAVSHSNSIYLGYRQGYTTGAANRLMIGMAADDPLISGHFTSDWLRINGYLELRDKSGTPDNFLALDGDKVIDSGIAIDDYKDWTNVSGTLWSDYNPGFSLTPKDIRVGEVFFDFATATASNTIMARNSSGYIAPVTIGSGLSFSSGTLSNSSTSPWTVSTSNEIYFNTAGNDIVGINTISPTRNLQVNGTGYFSQDLEIVQDLKAVTATTSFEDTDGDRGTSGDLLGRDANGLDWVSPSNISENDFNNDMPTGKASKGTNTTISVSGTVLTLSSLDINSPSGWSIGSGVYLEVPENGLYLVVVNFAKENSNCTSMTAVLRSDATTLYTWYPADYSNEIGFSASSIESLTSTSSLNVRVTSTTSGCNVFNYEISATKLSD